MNPDQDTQSVGFRNVWRADVTAVRDEVLQIWREHGGPVGPEAEVRLTQLVFVVTDVNGKVCGMSTAFPVYLKRLRSHFFAVRLMLTPGKRFAGLMPKLLVMTRDHLEAVHQDEPAPRPIGIVTLVENEEIKRAYNHAVWPASGMVYIGDSDKGFPLRVYYFAGARIKP